MLNGEKKSDVKTLLKKTKSLNLCNAVWYTIILEVLVYIFQKEKNGNRAIKPE